MSRPINGYEIMELGFKGPIIKEITNAIDELLLEDPSITKEECKEFILNNFGNKK